MKKVWTFQSIHVLNKILQKEYKGSSFEFAKKYWGINFAIAYKWLDQYTYHNNKSPIFVWTQKPDFRKNEYKYQDNIKKMVLIELEIDNSQICYVDFSDWGYILSQIPIRNEKLYKQLEKKHKIYNFDCLSQKERKLVINTWPKVFNQKKYKNQAIIPLITKSMIKKITYFK